MLTTVFTIGLLPALSATSNFRLDKTVIPFWPDGGQSCTTGTLTVGPSIQKAPGMSAETVIQASIMWGSFVLKKPGEGSGRGPGIPIRGRARTRLSSVG